MEMGRQGVSDAAVDSEPQSPVPSTPGNWECGRRSLAASQAALGNPVSH